MLWGIRQRRNAQMHTCVHGVVAMPMMHQLETSIISSQVCTLRDRLLLENKPIFMEFFEKVEVANFEIASDAFSTFKVRVVCDYSASGTQHLTLPSRWCVSAIQICPSRVRTRLCWHAHLACMARLHCLGSPHHCMYILCPQDVLTRHKGLVATYLMENYSEVRAHSLQLLQVDCTTYCSPWCHPQ